MSTATEGEQGQLMREQGQMVRPAMRKPVFLKVDQLKPGTNGHTLSVKVLESKTVLQKSRAASTQPRQSKISECIVGDETGTIIFTARNDQVRTTTQRKRDDLQSEMERMEWKRRYIMWNYEGHREVL